MQSNIEECNPISTLSWHLCKQIFVDDKGFAIYFGCSIYLSRESNFVKQTFLCQHRIRWKSFARQNITSFIIFKFLWLSNHYGQLYVSYILLVFFLTCKYSDIYSWNSLLQKPFAKYFKPKTRTQTLLCNIMIAIHPTVIT